VDVCRKIVECRRSAPSPTDGEAGTSWRTESTESTVGAFDSKDSKDSKDLPGVTAVPTDTPQFPQAIGFRSSFFFGCIYQVATLACRHGKILSPLSSCEVLSS
jgi:hypothetical protein